MTLTSTRIGARSPMTRLAPALPGLLLTLAALAPLPASGATIGPAINGPYHFAKPERGASVGQLQLGQLGPQVVIAVASRRGVPPAVYTFQKEESSTLQTAVFMVKQMALYLLQYDDESFVVCQPDGVLGRKVWSKFAYFNFYSKDPAKVKATPEADLQAWALGLSKKIMSQDPGEVAHASGTYHFATPVTFMGKKRRTCQVTFEAEPGKKILVQKDPGGSGAGEVYEHLPEESELAGMDVYRHATSHYLFDVGDGVLVSVFSNAGGLGKKEWGDHQYNVLSSELAHVRKLLASKEEQDRIDAMLTRVFADVKAGLEARTGGG